MKKKDNTKDNMIEAIVKELKKILNSNKTFDEMQIATEDFLRQSLQEVREQTSEEIEKRLEILMPEKIAKELSKNLEEFYPNGEGGCAICGTNPLRQRKMILQSLKSNKQEEGR